MRRTLSAPALTAMALSLAACGSTEATSASGGGAATDGPPAWNRAVTPPTDDEAESRRASCDYKAGSLPAETQGASHPNGDAIPIRHILVLMQENRSFDHYFQKLPEGGQPDVDVAPLDY